MIDVLLNVLLPIAVVAGVGFALRRRLQLDVGTLNRVMIYGLSPALIFVSLVRTDLAGGDAVRMVALSVAVVAAMALVTVAAAAPLGLRGGDLSALLLTTLFMNTGNYGLPAARFAFGQSGFEQALLYFIAQSIMAQTLGVAVAAIGGAAGRADPLRTAAARLARMPQIYAVAGALAIRAAGLDLTAASGLVGGLWRGAELVAEAALPVMLLILGMQLGAGEAIEAPRLVAAATALRLVVSPVIAFGLGLALGLSGTALSIGVMLAGMPTAVNMTILATEFNVRPPLVVGTVIASSLASLGTLSLLLWSLGV